MDENQLQYARAMSQQALIMKNFAKISHDCFNRCVPKPGKSLSSTEDTCLTNCVERLEDAQVFLIERLQQLA
jgi:hypothetical protein